MLACACGPIFNFEDGRSAKDFAADNCEVRVVTAGVGKVLAEFGSDLAGADATPELQRFAEPILKRGLAKYLPGMCECANFRTLVLGSRMAVNGGKTLGYSIRAQGLIVVSVDSPEEEAGHNLERALHHEFYHLLDDSRTRSDPEWEGTNFDGFRYGEEGVRLLQASARSAVWVPGLVSAYAAESPGEDKAELFSVLFTDPWQLYSRASQDQIIKEKMLLLKQRLEAQCTAALFFGPSGQPAPEGFW